MTEGSTIAAKGTAMFGEAIVCYLFLGGLGAGACFVLSIMGLLVPRSLITCWRRGRSGRMTEYLDIPQQTYGKLFFPAFGGSFVALALGIVCLSVDLGRVDRLGNLIASPTASYVVMGAFSLAADAALAFILALAWRGAFRRMRLWRLRILEVLAAVASLVTAAYTGLLLGSMPAVPLWNTPWLPALFVLSALSCGMALILVVAQLGGARRCFDAALRRIAAVDFVVVALEAACAVMVVLVSLRGFGLAAIEPSFDAASAAFDATQAAAIESARSLIAGEGAGVFWTLFVGAGLAVPLCLDAYIACTGRIPEGVACVLGACVLAGGFVMRYCIVEAGMHPALVPIGVM